MWESKMAINEIREIRSKTTVYLGVGAIEKIYDIASNLKNMNIDKVLIVTGRGAYKKTGAWEYVEKALEKENIAYIYIMKLHQIQL